MEGDLPIMAEGGAGDDGVLIAYGG